MSDVQVDAGSETAAEEVVETTEETNTEAEVSTSESRRERLLKLEEAFHQGKQAPTEPEPEPEATEEPEPEPEATEEPQAETDQDDEFTRRFAQLSKMEAKLRAREEEFKQLDGLKEELAQFQELKTLAKSDPMRVADALGLSLHDLAEQTISGEDFKDKRKVDEVAERLERLEEQRKQEEQAKVQREQEEQARKYVSKIEENIRAESDKYPLVLGLSGGMQLVINTITEWYNRTGEEMAWDKAAKMTEDYLTDQKIKEYEHLLKIDKIKKRVGAGVTDATPKTETTTTKEPEKAKTVKAITNQVASSPAAREVGKVTKEERERRIRELADNLFK